MTYKKSIFIVLFFALTHNTMYTGSSIFNPFGILSSLWQTVNHYRDPRNAYLGDKNKAKTVVDAQTQTTFRGYNDALLRKTQFQTVGVLAGIIAPTFRWSFKSAFGEFVEQSSGIETTYADLYDKNVQRDNTVLLGIFGIGACTWASLCCFANMNKIRKIRARDRATQNALAQNPAFHNVNVSDYFWQHKNAQQKQADLEYLKSEGSIPLYFGNKDHAVTIVDQSTQTTWRGYNDGMLKTAQWKTAGLLAAIAPFLYYSYKHVSCYGNRDSEYKNFGQSTPGPTCILIGSTFASISCLYNMNRIRKIRSIKQEIAQPGIPAEFLQSQLSAMRLDKMEKGLAQRTNVGGPKVADFFWQKEALRNPNIIVGKSNL